MNTDAGVLRAALTMCADTLDVIEREVDESPGGGNAGRLARNAARGIRALLGPSDVDPNPEPMEVTPS